MKRFNTMKNGYKFDKFIFWGIAIFFIGVVFIMGLKEGFYHHPYVNCKAETCENPLLSAKCTHAFGLIDCNVVCNEKWCTQEILTRGEYGEKPKLTGGNFSLIFFSVLLLGFVFNHYKHNRGVKIDLPDIET